MGGRGRAPLEPGCPPRREPRLPRDAAPPERTERGPYAAGPVRRAGRAGRRRGSSTAHPPDPRRAPGRRARGRPAGDLGRRRARPAAHRRVAALAGGLRRGRTPRHGRHRPAPPSRPARDPGGRVRGAGRAGRDRERGPARSAAAQPPVHRRCGVPGPGHPDQQHRHRAVGVEPAYAAGSAEPHRAGRTGRAEQRPGDLDGPRCRSGPGRQPARRGGRRTAPGPRLPHCALDHHLGRRDRAAHPGGPGQRRPAAGHPDPEGRCAITGWPTSAGAARCPPCASASSRTGCSRWSSPTPASAP